VARHGLGTESLERRAVRVVERVEVDHLDFLGLQACCEALYLPDGICYCGVRRTTTQPHQKQYCAAVKVQSPAGAFLLV
jgi:hypothetical protein